MKKLITTALLLALIGLFSFALEEPDTLSYGALRTYVLNQNPDVLVAKDSYSSLMLDYNDIVSKVKGIDTEGTNINVMGMSMYISFDAKTSLMLKLQKEYLPKSLYTDSLSLKDSIEITANGMELGIRSTYLDVKGKVDALDISKTKLEIAKMDFEGAKIKISGGLITIYDYDLKEYGYNLALSNFEKAKRDYESSIRNLNVQLGFNESHTYESINFQDNVVVELDLLEKYLQDALDNRIEINSVRRDLENLYLQKTIYESNNAYITYVSTQKEYAKILRDIQTKELELEKVTLEITEEIKGSYLTLENTIKNNESLKNAVNIQKSNLDKMKSNYTLGYVSKRDYLEYETASKELENNLTLSTLGMNISYLSFIFSTQSGSGAM